MKKYALTITLLLFWAIAPAQQTPEDDIRNVMQEQLEAWNRYDLEGFMQGYWKSDSLKFYGSSGVTYGWHNTLERYRKYYPSKEHTGTLRFVLHEITAIEQNSYYVMGEYHLERQVGNADGIFMVIFRRIEGKWLIVADTSS